MKKLLVISLAVVLVIGMSGIVNASFADSEMDEGLENSPAYGGSEGHWTHTSGAPRFDTDNGRIAINKEEPGENSDDSSAISHHTSGPENGSLIDTNN